MRNKEFEKAFEVIDSELKKAGISRREAFKLAGLGGAAFLAGGTQASAATVASASEAKGKIVIVGGGLAGVSTAARLANSLTDPDITVIEPNPKSVSYQAGTTLLASGVYDSQDDLIYETKDFFPKGVKLISDIAVDFNPDSNELTLSSGEVLKYDFLVVAAGVKLDFAAIKGLEDIGEAYTNGDASKILNVFNNNSITSVYNIQTAENMWKETQKFIQRAKSGENLKAVYTAPNTAVKCGGAPKKVMYLMNSRLNEAKARANVSLDYYDDSGRLFGVKEYADAIEKQFIARDMNWHLNHNLVEVNVANKIAIFNKHWEEKGAYDPDLEEHEVIKKSQNIEVSYDFLHITPPQKAPDEIGKSAIGSARGWVPVDKETLQHVKYKNIFSLGDIAAVPMGKTGGTVRKQYKVLVDNLISAMEGKELSSKFDGYTVCPLITDIGKVMLAEFNWSAKPAPSFPLDPTQERWIWWLLKVYMLKPMTQYGMLSGRA
ncbi:NAD(P)/FAD-dependent oxidoreductase [Aliarcobacter skirrowii]|jgi:sulfide:quinone oxidoreductase|uniref:NAD(P)/FAD-dependent oxidoreductase n=1 Tax=Aliarcobacter skirrowii TaxID=28200 RepID=UPI000824B8C9|nr:FAD/NAD(P)-binding oxidoreductase [Aliarcobacter skirrowii]MDD3025266.1 FAD/NAD(P)-binding oxidoreductase [Aliarcobacter skirrowii]MDX4047960.1 FAD/NAD(P)-binding oxidoreductase [Aliarcobacter skirrowii]MDX4057459.1 FAD/NAD(P)-binding oxidoreductase [Aliarcobacter skirrowii]MDX4061282.1 FAD/NAD(P)-binding oxidoreductase [Aliarcobacter skirrowii]RXJ77802.1 NAD(P)/FAD-dependent oxidoreductase [Aliarcobacter skirrowii]